MKKFIATFTGREKNAIGIFYKITDIVEADDQEQARLKLYDKYEHIHQLTFEEVTNK